MELGEPIAVYVSPEAPKTYPTIDDLVGIAKEFANDVVEGIEHKDTYKRYGLTPNKSFFLNGAPGTGKTFALKALNNTFNKTLATLIEEGAMTTKDIEDTLNYQVAMVSYDIGDYGTAYVNRGSRIIQEFFNQVYNMSYGCPVIIQLDEADALLASRTLNTYNTGEDKKNLETLMKNLQIANDMPDVYVVMMTNLKEFVDDAVLRAGRVDKHYTLGLPDYQIRKQLFNKIITNRDEKCEYSMFRGIDYDKLAELSKDFTPADIASVVDNSVRTKVKDIIRKEKETNAEIHGYVTQSQLEDRIKEHRKEFKPEEDDVDKYIL